MRNYEGRQKDLKTRINRHLTKLTGQELDFFSKLKQEDLLELKSVLTDINNVLTLKMTIKAVRWISHLFEFDKEAIKRITHHVDQTKPNTAGYDINIISPLKILAEVKCVIPVNKGYQYGAAQWNGILDDAIKLKKGKGGIKDTSEFLKFLFLIDRGEKTDFAISKLLKESRSTCDNPVRINRHEIKCHIRLLENKIKKEEISRDYIYIVKLKA